MITSPASASFSQLIKAKALDLGFDACGITKARRMDEESKRLLAWLQEGHQGSMAFMENNLEKRVNPAELEIGAKSVISVLLNYFTDQKQEDPDAPVISKYALGKDYHQVVKERLYELLSYIQNELAPCKGRAFVDSAPLLEKALARESGLGWIGKNSLLIHPKMGSFHFLGELVLDLELDCDEPFGENLCGSCTRCMESCPTKAIVAPHVLDASKCITYLTLETKNEIPAELAQSLCNRLAGCDICQLVCPWNSKATENKTPEFQPQSDLITMKAADWQSLDKPTFDRIFKDSTIERLGHARLKNTIRLLSGTK